ncbi:MAG: hypothetical protein KY410_10290, partial [Proteobacteria bacterium]|nr:hypothetical protein [Pseudomonadota bacterium]
MSPGSQRSSGHDDTITAVATPPGRGGVGIVRLSGKSAARIAEALAGPMPEPRHAAWRRFRDGDDNVIDEGLLLFFPGPRSFTGEDVVEFQGHGGPVVLDLLLQALLAQGARIARPGEFSERAFLNDRMDLAQAEAVADLIDAGSAQAARAALRSLHGDFSARIHELVDGLINARMHVEAAIDFPEEEVDFLSDNALRERLARVRQQFEHLAATAKQGRLLHDGLTVVIAGPPDAVAALRDPVREAGGRLVPLDVEGAFHSAAMSPAVPALAQALGGAPVADPVVPFVTGVGARTLTTGSAVADALL